MTHINDNTPETYLNVQSVSFIVQQDGSAVFKYASVQLLEFSLTPAIMSKTAITASVNLVYASYTINVKSVFNTRVLYMQNLAKSAALKRYK